MVTIAPGKDSGRAPLTHPGEELIYLLSGSLEFEARAAYGLRQGDSLHLRTDRPHRLRNSSTRPAQGVVDLAPYAVTAAAQPACSDDRPR